MKLLFIINPAAGNGDTDFSEAIRTYFSKLTYSIELYSITKDCSIEKVKEKIKQSSPDKVIAVGGDGTIKLVAEAILETGIPLGIIAAGSANGMAKELGISPDINEALETVLHGYLKKIHTIKVNDQLCIHLSDIGFNAFVIKKFDALKKRGMWSYVKAAWKVLLQHPVMQVNIHTGNALIKREAAMVVIANATKYGTGVLINPKGTLEDALFEVIILKKISFLEIFKMRFTHTPYDPSKTELLQTASLHITSKRKAHFQVDGEYMGKVNKINADILPASLQVIVPNSNF